ncbi:uncharacterized protein LOC128190690 [Crassostrea angulata]|uniref:uncharacterized protein LOC128190690 n=1 Tax=Magallana angulata TaxID=2784310 RepID=UPI0022B19A1C|nr:uncharacterized protein LOC128190690 [Crassostrea angulata]
MELQLTPCLALDMASQRISFLVVLLCTIVVTESFAVVRFWRPQGSIIENKDGKNNNKINNKNNTSTSNEMETERQERNNDTVLVVVWGSICVMFLVACGLIVVLNTSKISVRHVKLEEGLIKHNDQNKNYLCRLKLTENPLYSIKWGQPLPTIPEEDADEYIAVTGYLTFHRPTPKRKNMDESMNTKQDVAIAIHPLISPRLM